MNCASNFLTKTDSQHNNKSELGMYSKTIIQKLPPCIVNIGRDSYARVIGTPAILQ